jgi:3-hydroxyisobutyrate dehydrogenase-like beta-hydroxyacid dehydrogenase
MKIALEECERMGISLPWLSLANELYNNLIEHWEENLWTQALIKVIKRMNNI